MSAYTKKVVALLQEDSGGGCQVVVLQRGLQVVGDSQVVIGLDQEVVVDSGVLKIMNQGCDVGGQQAQAVGPLALQHAAMHHEHMGHLEYRRHMGAASSTTKLHL